MGPLYTALQERVRQLLWVRETTRLVAQTCTGKRVSLRALPQLSTVEAQRTALAMGSYTTALVADTAIAVGQIPVDVQARARLGTTVVLDR